MPWASTRRQGFGHGPEPLRDRAGAVALALVAHVLILAVLMLVRAPSNVMLMQDRLTTILLPPPKPIPPEKLSPPRRLTRHASPELKRVQEPMPRPLPDMPAPAVVTPLVDLPKTDVALAGPSSTDQGPSARAGAGEGSAGNGKGTGSGGAKLYEAEWQSLNTAEELARHAPHSGARQGWGEIACRTAESFKVTDCRILDEFPEGSGFGRAVQDTARLFRVKPPRVDGKPQIGAWVRIRIGYDFSPRAF